MQPESGMTLVIEFYDHDEKLAAERCLGTIDDALKAARASLAIHKARHALVRDLDRDGMVIELVHRDVLP